MAGYCIPRIRIPIQVKNHLKKMTTVLAVLAGQAMADTSDARCEIYPAGQDHSDKVIPCTFSQRQGYVTISRGDGVVHELSPVGDKPGNFADQDGRAVYRQSGLGDQGLIFRFPNESVYVYWNAESLTSVDSGNPTYPFSTSDLRCNHAPTLPHGQRIGVWYLPGRHITHGRPPGVYRSDQPGGRAVHDQLPDRHSQRHQSGGRRQPCRRYVDGHDRRWRCVRGTASSDRGRLNRHQEFILLDSAAGQCRQLC